ncbi:unnamed protein product [Darwinula stevensoni]|uniref:Protein-glucosylgalactosylhydroxylysine glucosidase n=1 Tax=Darwinula stevensoni TaxID=69355 RepID=A0A7R8XAL2_9CRUS|nr:unnamed protein product [Darwinula stevensoni]CAG0885595.1 unnamed protein product [Darwinula stevensoni]
MEDLRHVGDKWSLETDAQLLSHLQDFSQKVVQQTLDLQKKLDNVVQDAELAAVKVDNINNAFLMLSNTQFVENRVYEDDLSIPQEGKIPEVMSPAEKEAGVIKKVTAALQCGMSVMKEAYQPLPLHDSDSDDDNPSRIRVALRPKDLYEGRPLPCIIGSSQFFEDDYVGLPQPESESSRQNDLSCHEESFSAIGNGEEHFNTLDSHVIDGEEIGWGDDVVADSKKNTKPKDDDLFRESSSDEERLDNLSEGAADDNDNISSDKLAKQADFASELAARLRVAARMTDTDGAEDKPRAQAPSQVKKEHTGGLFDDDGDEADSPFTNPSYIFSSIASHKTDENHPIKQPDAAKSSQVISTATGGRDESFIAAKKPLQTGGLFDDSDNEDDLFTHPFPKPSIPGIQSLQTKGDKPSEKSSHEQGQTDRQRFFDESSSDEDIFTDLPATVPKKSEHVHEKKVPVGGVSIFGTQMPSLVAAVRAEKERSMSGSTLPSSATDQLAPVLPQFSEGFHQGGASIEEPNHPVLKRSVPSIFDNGDDEIESKDSLPGQEAHDSGKTRVTKITEKTRVSEPATAVRKEAAVEGKPRAVSQGLFSDSDEDDSLFIGNMANPVNPVKVPSPLLPERSNERNSKVHEKSGKHEEVVPSLFDERGDEFFQGNKRKTGEASMKPPSVVPKPSLTTALEGKQARKLKGLFSDNDSLSDAEVNTNSTKKSTPTMSHGASLFSDEESEDDDNSSPAPKKESKPVKTLDVRDSEGSSIQKPKQSPILDKRTGASVRNMNDNPKRLSSSLFSSSESDSEPSTLPLVQNASGSATNDTNKMSFHPPKYPQSSPKEQAPSTHISRRSPDIIPPTPKVGKKEEVKALVPQAVIPSLFSSDESENEAAPIQIPSVSKQEHASAVTSLIPSAESPQKPAPSPAFITDPLSASSVPEKDEQEQNPLFLEGSFPHSPAKLPTETWKDPFFTSPILNGSKRENTSSGPFKDTKESIVDSSESASCSLEKPNLQSKVSSLFDSDDDEEFASPVNPSETSHGDFKSDLNNSSIDGKSKAESISEGSRSIRSVEESDAMTILSESPPKLQPSDNQKEKERVEEVKLPASPILFEVTDSGTPKGVNAIDSPSSMPKLPVREKPPIPKKSLKTSLSSERQGFASKLDSMFGGERVNKGAKKPIGGVALFGGSLIPIPGKLLTSKSVSDARFESKPKVHVSDSEDEDAGEEEEEEKPRRSVQELAKSLSMSIIPQSHLPGASPSFRSCLESGVSIEEAAQVNILPSNIKDRVKVPTRRRLPTSKKRRETSRISGVDFLNAPDAPDMALDNSEDAVQGAEGVKSCEGSAENQSIEEEKPAVSLKAMMIPPEPPPPPMQDLPDINKEVLKSKITLKSEVANRRSKSPVEPVSEQSPINLRTGSPDLFPDDRETEDLFSKPSKTARGLFAEARPSADKGDDEDIFAGLKKEPTESKKNLSLFDDLDSDDDIFSDLKGKKGTDVLFKNGHEGNFGTPVFQVSLARIVMKIQLPIISLLVLLVISSSAQEDISDDPYVFATRTLPEDGGGEIQTRLMPTLGNGFIATTVFSDALYMDDLFNGVGGRSHRAKIPSRVNYWMDFSSELQIIDDIFALHVDTGVFERNVTLSNEVLVQQVIFASAESQHIMAMQIYFHAPQNSSMELKLTARGDFTTDDLELSDPLQQDGYVFYCGQTKEVEDEGFQPFPQQVCVLWQEPPEDFFSVDVPGSVSFYSAHAREFQEAQQAMDAVRNRDDEVVLEEHAEIWRGLIVEHGIEIQGNLELARLLSPSSLAKVINGARYYIQCSLGTKSEMVTTGGLSPGGLSYGALALDYQGHSFWDTETWMYPSYLLFHPDLAKKSVKYRAVRVTAAEENAAAHGDQGCRFPWESAYTGVEVTPDCCPEVAEYQIHINGDISFATRQFVAAHIQNADLEAWSDWLESIARFWIGRTEFNETTGFYDINHVMPPDEDHPDVNNSAYTNVVAAYSIFFIEHLYCLMDKVLGPEWEDFMAIARRLKLPYDPEMDYHPEYDGYPLGEEIKQADVILMGYPLMYPMSASTRRNDLELYEDAVRDDGPAMTWSMHSIGWLDVGELDRANGMLEESFLPYYREPFKVWTEMRVGIGAMNFITGMGGFLQGILFGFGGLRLTLADLSVQRSALPLDATSMAFRGRTHSRYAVALAILLY